MATTRHHPFNVTTPQPTTESINLHPLEKDFTRERSIDPQPQNQTTHSLNPPARHNQQLPPKPQTHQNLQKPKTTNSSTSHKPTTNLFEKITTTVIQTKTITYPNDNHLLQPSAQSFAQKNQQKGLETTDPNPNPKPLTKTTNNHPHSHRSTLRRTPPWL